MIKITDKREAWEHMKIHNPDAAEFIKQMKEAFGDIEFGGYWVKR